MSIWTSRHPVTLLERTETDESQMTVTIIYYIGPVLRLTYR